MMPRQPNHRIGENMAEEEASTEMRKSVKGVFEIAGHHTTLLMEKASLCDNMRNASPEEKQ